jgi:conjugative transfer pilus assembly protein TraH
MTTRPKRFMACLLAATLATAPTASQSANLNAEMQAMFNDLGALGNVTSPGAFRGQAMNLYTGGGLMMRAPGRNYPLVNAQLPSLRAGCGGIDLFGGAFSFINKQQFVALLQNIGSNAIGYAFKLALQSISPDIDKLLTELQDQMNKINAMNINSCEAAQSWSTASSANTTIRCKAAAPTSPSTWAASPTGSMPGSPVPPTPRRWSRTPPIPAIRTCATPPSSRAT